MQTAIAVPADASAIVFTRGADVFTDSRTVAVNFDKNHRDVLRAIDALIAQEPSLCPRNFAQASVRVPMPNGGTRSERRFDMDRRGFSILAMGFTGPAALRWKLRFMDAFEAMEAELHRAAEPARTGLDPNDPAQLRALLIDYSERAIALQGRVAELEPKAVALERIAEAEGSFCITDAAKTLRMQPKELFAWMRSNRWIFRRPGTTIDRAFETVRQAGYLRHALSAPDARGRTFDQVRVTPKGMAHLAGIFVQTTLLIIDKGH